MEWQEQLSKKGYVQIKNFLPIEQALSLRKQILTITHPKAWQLLSTPYYPLSHIKDRMVSPVIDKSRHRQAKMANARRQFAFSFYRSNNSHNKNHQAKEINKQFSDEIIKQICPTLDLSGELRDVFFASFIKGQFLSYHSDGSAGKYAFVYQLSSGWQEKYGGHLELFPRKIKFYKKSLIPQFNSLALLKLSHPMNHRVRLLNNPPHKHRITISGWLE